MAIILFLIFGHNLTPGAEEPFIILILFYNSLLLIASTNIVHWWKCHTGRPRIPPEYEITTQAIVIIPVEHVSESPSQKIRRLQISSTQKLQGF